MTFVMLMGLALVAVGALNLLPVIAGVHPSRWSAVFGGGAIVVVASVNLWRIQIASRGR